MRERAEGRIHERVTAVASAAYPGYVVQGDRASLMIDAGLNLLGPRYLAALRELYGEESGPDYLLLTHSHYDHVGAASYLKTAPAGLRIAGHERLAGLLQKPSALELMNQAQRRPCGAARRSALRAEDLTIQPLALDLPLKEGDEARAWRAYLQGVRDARAHQGLAVVSLPRDRSPVRGGRVRRARGRDR